jgi:cell division protein FtsL
MRRIDAPRRRPRRPLERRDGYRAAADAAAVIEQRPQFRVVPRRRLAANFAAISVVVIGVLMLAAVVLQTRLAERQLEIDRLERQVSAAHANFDVLRQQRADLRSPTRLAAEASGLGMFTAVETEFVAIDPLVVAQILAATGTIDPEDGTLIETDPLDQVRRVRAAEAGVEMDELPR